MSKDRREEFLLDMFRGSIMMLYRYMPADATRGFCLAMEAMC